MPFAVTHILVSLFFIDLYRRFILKRKDFPPWLVFIGGLAGLLPDIDYVIYWILQIFITIDPLLIHGPYTHNLFIPLALLVLSLCFWKWKTTSHVFIIISMGYTIHLLLDALFSQKALLYPLSSMKFGLDLIPDASLIPFYMSLDAILLVLWLFYEWKTKKIRSFT